MFLMKICYFVYYYLVFTGSFLHLCNLFDLQDQLQYFSLGELHKTLQSKPFVTPNIGEEHFDSNDIFLT